MPVTVENNIIYGGPIDARITKGERSLGEFILNHFDESGDKIVLVNGLNEMEVSARAIKENSIEVAKNLQALGIKEGDRVAICCENRLEFVYAMFATILLNATFAPFNAAYTERELHHDIGLYNPKVIFASSSTIKKVKAIAEKNSLIKFIIDFDDNSLCRNILAYSKFLKIHRDHTTFKARPTNLDENIAVILFSSGTTGLPKGVQMSQGNVLFNIDIHYENNNSIVDLTVLSLMPWFGAYGLLSLMNLPVVGVKLVFLPNFQENQFLKSIQKYRVDICLMVPPMMVLLAKDPMVDQYDLSSLKVLFCTAAPLSKEIEDVVRARIGVPIISQAYGLTEATLMLVQSQNSYKSGSVGTIRKATYVKVLDTETCEALGPNQSGELCFKGQLLMKGYIGDKKATEECIDNEGWLHTGDVGYYDEEYNFFIVDRLKELIKYKGLQVPPAEIEALILTHPNIRDAAVVGQPDETCGELPVAFVVRKDSSLTQKEVIDFVAERLSFAKRLHGGVRFVDEIPKNQTGKILRRILREMLEKELKSKL